LVCLLWVVELRTGHPSWNRARTVLLDIAVVYALSALAYRAYLRRRPFGGLSAQYAFLVLDPLFLVLAFTLDAERLSLLHPFLIIVIVRCGIRYGTRAMWLAWWTSCITAAIALPTSQHWRNQPELSAAFAILLGFVPMFFNRLIRRVHHVRQIEEERARLNAMHEVIAARSAFLAKVSHELRSPLQSIVSALDVFEMRHGHGAAGDDELIGRMRRSSMLLNTQLRDLLTLARGQAGRLEMRPEPFEACSLVEGVVLAARDGAIEKGLTLDLALPRDAIFVVADGARIDQVLTNLVLNSIRYTDRGSVHLVLHPYDMPAKRLRFTISDTGPGISADRLPTLFQPEKLGTSTDRKGEGSGIGLAVVRTLVEHLGGLVSVRSELGVGTTFDLDIPAELIDPEESSRPSRSATGRVLIVDDHAEVLSGLTSVIHELGYECDRASTVVTAANLLAARRYDAVLLDIQMPGKSGAQIAEETRSGQGPNRQTRLLGMSAAEVTALHAHGPFDACLTKPIDRNALISALREEWPESWPSSVI
jgi:signal transduction histidine kinase/ActR/RegA family two-component response regulator